MTANAHRDLTMLSFLTALEKRLREQDFEGMLARLMKYAETIPPANRGEFLHLFSNSFITEASAPEQPAYTPNPELLEEVDAFLGDLRGQTYVEEMRSRRNW